MTAHARDTRALCFMILKMMRDMLLLRATIALRHCHIERFIRMMMLRERLLRELRSSVLYDVRRYQAAQRDYDVCAMMSFDIKMHCRCVAIHATMRNAQYALLRIRYRARRCCCSSARDDYSLKNCLALRYDARRRAMMRVVARVLRYVTLHSADISRRYAFCRYFIRVRHAVTLIAALLIRHCRCRRRC